jgi:hypothetical protein
MIEETEIVSSDYDLRPLRSNLIDGVYHCVSDSVEVCTMNEGLNTELN